MKYLVVNNSTNALYSFSEQFQLFEDRENAIEHYKKIGGEDDMFGLSKRTGVASIMKRGLIDVMFMPIEIQ